ncbi:MAG: hypothetical protein P8N49_02865, partial [Opitutales bacterium]|nr:hypothetical protein [Opitutales bacterium]
MTKIPALLSFLIPSFFLWSANPVPYTGKIDIGGVNYYGEAQFAFSLHDGNGTTHWRNGTQPGETIKVMIRNGRYTVLLGGQGMNPLHPTLFLDHDPLYLKVQLDTNDSTGLRHLGPDQLITSTPRALAAEWAKLAQGVPAGAITRGMLSADVQADLNRTEIITDTSTSFSPQSGSIARSMLASDVLADLNQSIKTITRDMLPSSVLADLNRTVTKSMLGSDVLADLNVSLAAGSISRDKLSTDVLADLNRTVTPQMLEPSSITTAQLNEQILKYLKPEITQAPQAPGLIFNGQT